MYFRFLGHAKHQGIQPSEFVRSAIEAKLELIEGGK
jgi:hypothetical protein